MKKLVQLGPLVALAVLAVFLTGCAAGGEDTAIKGEVKTAPEGKAAPEGKPVGNTLPNDQ